MSQKNDYSLAKGAGAVPLPRVFLPPLARGTQGTLQNRGPSLGGLHHPSRTSPIPSQAPQKAQKGRVRQQSWSMKGCGVPRFPPRAGSPGVSKELMGAETPPSTTQREAEAPQHPPGSPWAETTQGRAWHFRESRFRRRWQGHGTKGKTFTTCQRTAGSVFL